MTVSSMSLMTPSSALAPATRTGADTRGTPSASGDSSSSSTMCQPERTPAGGGTHSSRKPSSSVTPSQRLSPQRTATCALAISRVM